MTLRDVDARPGEDLVAVRSLGSWVLAVEINGWQGSRTEVLARISRGTRAVSAFWNVNALTRFSYAVEGRVLTAFEAMSPDSRQGAEPDALEATRVGLPWDDLCNSKQPHLPRSRAELLAEPDPLITGLDLLTLALGIKVSEDLARGPLLTVRRGS
jgi:hypothetical protein